MTLAEMTEEEKNAISHRGNAVKKIAPLLGEDEANEDCRM